MRTSSPFRQSETLEEGDNYSYEEEVTGEEEQNRRMDRVGQRGVGLTEGGGEQFKECVKLPSPK